MSVQSQLTEGLRKIIERAGTPIRVQYFTQIYDNVYDEATNLVQSGGDLWTSGIVLPISQSNSSDSILIEQGKIILDDKKLFVHGSLVFTGSEMTIAIRIGSPATESDKQYSMLAFSRRIDVSNTPIYKQIYIRQIGGTGSLFGTEII